MKNNKNIVLTADGYKELENEINLLIEEFNKNEIDMSNSFHNSAGDGAHDNGEFEALLQKEKLLAGRINEMKKRLASAEIIDVPELSDDQININDTVILRMVYDVDDFEEDTYKLVGGDGNIMLNEISINSPIGKAIFMKNVGDNVEYTVNGNTFTAMIVDKVRELKK